SKHVTVALAGEGSDELFGGYRRYFVENTFRKYNAICKPLALIAKTLLFFPNLMTRRQRILLESIIRENAGARYSTYFEGTEKFEKLIKSNQRSPHQVRDGLNILYPGSSDLSPLAAMCLADQQYWLVDSYLEKSDKGSMSSSLEVRVPFLDNDIVDFANSLPDELRVKGTKGKIVLKEAFKNLLPKQLFEGSKRGFAVPHSRWLRHELHDYFRRNVLGDDAKVKNLLEMSKIKELADIHHQGSADHSIVLWRVLVLEIWLRLMESGFKKPETNGHIF
ncbi:MAG: asparagine synthase-related protein, partial [Limisphaerales bacterium]